MSSSRHWAFCDVGSGNKVELQFGAVGIGVRARLTQRCSESA